MSKPRRPRRPIDGILLFDKPAGITSNQALQWVKHRYQAEKAGHTGSLDPLATGLLPMCLGEATKFSHYLLEADKVYATRLRLGQQTTTADAEGEVVRERVVPVLSQADFERVLSDFRGEIMQVPSMYSALKHEGKPLYEYARAGIEIERPARPVTIYRLEITAFEPPFVELEVSCSKGTYIRNLVEDIGEALGCGAHVTVLRRLAAGPFVLADAFSRDQVQQAENAGGFDQLDAFLLPSWAGLADWPRVELSGTSAYYLRHGNPVQARSLPKDHPVLIFEQGEAGSESIFLGVGEADDDGLLAPRRLLRCTH